MADDVLIGQRFRLGRVVRESGIAIVYEAKHRNGADAWIKLPRGPEHAAALLREARVANALGTRAVNVRDDGQTNDGLPYLVLEPVTGQRLDHWRASLGGRAPPDEAMGLGDELCAAIGTMHGAGFAVGLLRADAIIVLPKGGMCLLELEHSRAATAATVKEDVARVGRVLYEMLSGTPCLAQSAPLHVAAPELPRAVTSTIDDAARGRFETIDELRAALRRSMPEWLGPPRRPMPSLTPDALVNAPFADTDPIAPPRPSNAHFDLQQLMDPSRVSATAGVGSASPRPSASATDQSTALLTDLSPPEPARASKRGVGGGVIAGASAIFVFVAAIGIGVFALAKHDVEPSAHGTTMATFAVAHEPADSPVESALPPATAAPRIDDAAEVIEVDEVDAAPPDASAPAVPSATVARNATAGVGETTFRFEGDLSPRLVIIDRIVVGVTTKELRTRCGTHSVKIGGKGATRTLDLPCDDEQGIIIESNGSWRPR